MILDYDVGTEGSTDSSIGRMISITCYPILQQLRLIQYSMYLHSEHDFKALFNYITESITENENTTQFIRVWLSDI